MEMRFEMEIKWRLENVIKTRLQFDLFKVRKTGYYKVGQKDQFKVNVSYHYKFGASG